MSTITPQIVKSDLEELLDSLANRAQPSKALTNIVDVLHTVDHQFDQYRDLVGTINRLVIYVTFTAFNSQTHFTARQDEILQTLAIFGQSASLHGFERGSYGNKKQFERL